MYSICIVYVYVYVYVHVYLGPPKPLKSQVPRKTSCFPGKDDVVHFPCFCNLVSSLFPSFDVLSLCVCHACTVIILNMQPFSWDIAHSAWCACCSNEWPHGSATTKPELVETGYDESKHCSRKIQRSLPGGPNSSVGCVSLIIPCPVVPKSLSSPAPKP